MNLTAGNFVRLYLCRVRTAIFFHVRLRYSGVEIFQHAEAGKCSYFELAPDTAGFRSAGDSLSE